MLFCSFCNLSLSDRFLSIRSSSLYLLFVAFFFVCGFSSSFFYCPTGVTTCFFFHGRVTFWLIRGPYLERQRVLLLPFCSSLFLFLVTRLLFRLLRCHWPFLRLSPSAVVTSSSTAPWPKKWRKIAEKTNRKSRKETLPFQRSKEFLFFFFKKQHLLACGTSACAVVRSSFVCWFYVEPNGWGGFELISRLPIGRGPSFIFRPTNGAREPPIQFSSFVFHLLYLVLPIFFT